MSCRGAGGRGLRLLSPLAAWLSRQMQQRRAAVIVVLPLALCLLPLASGGLSLNDGSLSLAAALHPAQLPLLLLVSAVSTALAAGLRGQSWNDSQAEALRG